MTRADEIELKFFNGHAAGCLRRGGATRVPRQLDCSCGFLDVLAGRTKAYVIIEHDIESSTVHCVTLDKTVADEIGRIDSMLSVQEWDTVEGVPVRTPVYVVAGEPGQEPEGVTEVLCWPWDHFLTYTVEPRILDRRVDFGLLPLGLRSSILASFGVPGPHPPPPTIVVQCQDRERAIATYRVQAGL